jgi:hypothetical protein
VQSGGGIFDTGKPTGSRWRLLTNAIDCRLASLFRA